MPTELTDSTLGKTPNPTAEKGGEVLTLSEAAVLLRCSKAHMSNLLSGKVSSLPPLPHIALGRRILIRRVVLEHWLERLEASGDPR